jgi:hypothetical protein
MPLLPLLLVVVFAGLALGGLLAKFFGRPPAGSPPPAPSPIPSITPIVTAPPSVQPSIAASPAASASASASPSPTPTAAPTQAPTPSPKPTPSAAVFVVTPPPKPAPAPVAPTPAATETPTVPPLAASAPAAAVPLLPPTAAPVVPASPAPGTAGAEAIVRKYLHALASGEESMATGYLMSGIPNETFMSPKATINSVEGARNPDGSYKVTADVSTPSGEYFETFKVEKGPYGLQIASHYTIRVQ